MDRLLPRAMSLVDEIQWTASRITTLRNAQMRAAGLDRHRWKVLLTVATSSYFLSISDLARLLKQSRQATHRMVLGLARAGWIELLPNRDDKRILQLELTRVGRSVVEDLRHRFKTSVLESSAHFDARALDNAAQVLRSLRERLAEFDLTSPSGSRRF